MKFRYKSSAPVFITILVLLIGLSFFRGFHPVFPVVLAIIYIVIVVYGSLTIQSGFHLKALCENSTDRKEIAITYDDGPDKEVTPALLDLLKEKGVKAGFFCIGKNIEGNETIISRMDQEGHLIGNHSYSHAFMFDFFPASWMVQDLMKAESKISTIIGKKPVCFRPPYGVTTPALRRAVESLFYKVIGWSIRSMDTKIKNDEELLERVKTKLKPGAIVLFHDTSPRIIDISANFIDYALKEGYKIVGYDKLLGINAYE